MNSSRHDGSKQRQDCSSWKRAICVFKRKFVTPEFWQLFACSISTISTSNHSKKSHGLHAVDPLSPLSLPVASRDVSVTHCCRWMLLVLQLHAMACSSENRAFAEAMARKAPLDKIVHLREAVDACVTKHYNGTKEKCGDEFQALVDCLHKNERHWSKCAALKSALEDCFGEHVL